MVMIFRATQKGFDFSVLHCRVREYTMYLHNYSAIFVKAYHVLHLWGGDKAVTTGSQWLSTLFETSNVMAAQVVG